MARPSTTPPDGDGAGLGPYYELRLYEMRQARLSAFHDLMGRQVPPLFARHGVSPPLALWEGHAGPFAPLYGYLLRWSNLDERMRAWGAFYSDSDWIAAMTQNYAGQQRVERAHISFMKAAPLWERFRPATDAEVDGIYELRRYDLRGLPKEASSSAIGDALDADRDGGGKVMGVFEPVIGTFAPQIVTFVARADECLGAGDLSGGTAFRALPPFDSFLLRPPDYGKAREGFAPRQTGPNAKAPPRAAGTADKNTNGSDTP
ncbi:MAG: NIPSNAP family protein [Rhizobiaceae bacterium]|nr:NIPSNAP family protein [Rhizobiaceae bacterium]MCV0404892.1 NIPSNAP family protein [Rhizobiaceae bacterium]